MRRKYLVICSIAVVMILLQADVIDCGRSGGRSRSRSRSRSGSSHYHFGSSSSHSSSSGSSSSSTQGGSHSKSSKPVHHSIQPEKNTFPSKHHTISTPKNPGYSSLDPKHGGGSSWGQYNTKPWKPKSPSTKLKHVAGAAVGGVVAGAVGGFLVGQAMSSMQFHFRSPEEERWWYENRNGYSDRVYFPNYNEQPVPEEVFVRDCVNVTVREFIEPSGNQTANEMEARVVTQVVHQMCTEEYRGKFSRHPRGGNFGKISEINRSGAVITGIEGRPNEGYSMAVTLQGSFLMLSFFLTNLLCV